MPLLVELRYIILILSLKPFPHLISFGSTPGHPECLLSMYLKFQVLNVKI